MDDHIRLLLSLIATVLLVLLNGFFVATEFALVKVRSTRIRELADNGNLSAKYADAAIRNLDAYLAATQFGITLASLGLGWIGEPVVSHRIVEPGMLALGLDIPEDTIKLISFGIAFAIITFAHIVFGELAPKSLAIQRAEATALWVAWPMRLFYWIFRPFITLLQGTANAVLRLVGLRVITGHDLVHSEEELRMIITASGTEQGGTLREMQTELLDNVFDFGRRLARQIMTHRTELVALDVNEALAESVRVAQEDGHTRYPVMQDDIDTVIGFVHTKDLFALYQREPAGDMRTVLREVLLVPETIRIDALLQKMQRDRQHMAVLVDEYGGTAGLVTVADVLEELVGALPDEFEQPEEEWITRVDAHTWTIDGRLPLPDLEEELGREISCEEACDTAGGFAFWAFGRIPEAGDHIALDGLTLRVLEMDGRRVSRLEVSLVADAAGEDELELPVQQPARAGNGRHAQ